MTQTPDTLADTLAALSPAQPTPSAVSLSTSRKRGRSPAASPAAAAKAPAPRNKTITLTEPEISEYSSRAISLKGKAALRDIIDKTIWQDTFEALKFLPANFADLVVVDPPYNLTKKFGTKEFKSMDWNDYKRWMDKWLAEVFISLKPKPVHLLGLEHVYRRSRNRRQIFSSEKPHHLGTGKRPQFRQ